MTIIVCVICNLVARFALEIVLNNLAHQDFAVSLLSLVNNAFPKMVNVRIVALPTSIAPKVLLASRVGVVIKSNIKGCAHLVAMRVIALKDFAYKVEMDEAFVRPFAGLTSSVLMVRFVV